jgi:histidyl-tRNA synthetase
MIKPSILKGTRDFGQDEMAKRNFVRDTIRSVFESFGYDPIETPVIEYAETILGKYGEEGDKLTYNFTDQGDRHIALRYDQTVPFARYFAANHGNLPIPFKRYEINRVWRADKPQKGRYREFYQCDVDIIGTESILAEMELIQIIATSLKRLGFNEFLININDRSLIDSILDSLKVTIESRISVIRIIDKVDKIGLEGVKAELLDLGLNQGQVDQLCVLIDRSGSNQDKLDRLKDFKSETLSQIFALAEKYDFSSNLVFDPSLARGLDYYTGLIVEATIPNTGLGSVAAGGRYANLCGTFSKQKFSGVGIALGFDRIVDALEILDLFKETKLNSDVLVTIFNSEMLDSAFALAEKIRQTGLNTELYFQADDMAKQFKYAQKKNTPFVLRQGPNELAENSAVLIDMKTEERTSFKLDETGLKELLAKIKG